MSDILSKTRAIRFPHFPPYRSVGQRSFTLASETGPVVLMDGESHEKFKSILTQIMDKCIRGHLKQDIGF